MIARDQPRLFGNAVAAAVSSVSDGTMKFGTGDPAIVRRNLLRFTGEYGYEAETVRYLDVLYDRTAFTHYETAAMAEAPLAKTTADGFATNVPGVLLVLPLADCTGAILYDPMCRAVMISHLGRHSTEQEGAYASVAYMNRQFGSKAQDLLVWLGPSPNGHVYPLWKRDNMGLIEANTRDLVKAGVKPESIEASSVDTANNPQYFSHSEFLLGNRSEDGRFAIIAALR